MSMLSVRRLHQVRTQATLESSDLYLSENTGNCTCIEFSAMLYLFYFRSEIRLEKLIKIVHLTHLSRVAHYFKRAPFGKKIMFDFLLPVICIVLKPVKIVNQGDLSIRE